MSAYDDLIDEQRIRLAQQSVRYGVPIAPQIAAWLHDNGLYDQVTNPRKIDASKTRTETTDGGTA